MLKGAYKESLSLDVNKNVRESIGMKAEGKINVTLHNKS